VAAPVHCPGGTLKSAADAAPPTAPCNVVDGDLRISASDLAAELTSLSRLHRAEAWRARSRFDTVLLAGPATIVAPTFSTLGRDIVEVR